MLSGSTLNPPIQYNIIWLLIGCLVLLSVIIWCSFAFWLTRPKAYKTIADLKQLPVDGGLAALKAKYLQLIEESYQLYQRKEIDLRRLHSNLSMLARYFVFEARHFPAPLLTLSDLKKGPYPTLTGVIEAYYPEEFAAIGHGAAEKSVEAAKGMILQWV